MNKLVKSVLVLAPVVLVSQAMAAVPAGITTLITDATATRTDIQDYALFVLVFSIIIGIAWKLAGRKG